MTKKNKKNWYDYLGLLINGFLLIFFILYIGKVGISNLIFEGTDKWKMIFNIGVWYVLVTVTGDKFFEILYK